MKNISEILVSIIAVIAIISLFYGFKKAAFGFSIKAGSTGINKNYRKPRIVKFFINLYGIKKKILYIFIFVILTMGFYLLFRNLIFGLLVSSCLEIYLVDFLNGIEERRKNLLNVQLVEFISNMAVLLKAGKTVRAVFKESAGNFKDPLRTHLYMAANEMELNYTLDEALDGFSKGCRSREVDLLTSSLKINRKIGGDIVSMLDAIAESVRYNLKIKSQINTMSLQSRYSGNIISLFPVIVLISMCIFINRNVLDFFSTGIGKVSIIAGGILEIAGIMAIKKIINFGG